MSQSTEDLPPALSTALSPGRLAEAEAERLRAERIAIEETEARYRAEKAARRAAEARERAEAEARERVGALGRALAEAEAALAERARVLAETEARAAALAEEVAAKSAEAAREAAEAAKKAARVRAAEAELDRLRDYGARLETRHQRLLGSRGFRLLEPARRAARLVSGAKPPAPFKPLLGPPPAPPPAPEAEGLPAPEAARKTMARKTTKKKAAEKKAGKKAAVAQVTAPEAVPEPRVAPPPPTPPSAPLAMPDGTGFAEAATDFAPASPPGGSAAKKLPPEEVIPSEITREEMTPEEPASEELATQEQAPGEPREEAPKRRRRRDRKARRPSDPSRALGTAERHALALEILSRARGGAEGLLALSDELGARRGEGAAFLSRLTLLLALSDRSAFTEAAGLVEEITARFPVDWIEVSFPPALARRLWITGAVALTRVGRGAEGRALLDAAIVRPPRGPRELPPEPGEAPAGALLLARAELVWPEDPDAARADLARLAEREPLAPASRVLLSWLDHLDGAAPEVFAGRLAEHRQTRLILAQAALAAGDFTRYRAAVNDFFAEQGLLAPIPEAAAAFALGALSTPPGEAITREGPLVSVIMTAFQSRDTIDMALGSIRAQTHGNLEILVVDDGSSDGTRERLAEIAAEDPRVRVILNSENLGTYCAKNRAMAEARGAYLTFHDSDDWAHPERIARHVGVMEADPTLIATRSDWLRVEGDGALNFRRWKKRFQHPNPASTFLRRGAIETAGYFDSVRFGADSEYWFRLKAIFGKRIRSIALTLGFGALRAGSLTRAGSGSMDAENYAPARGAYSGAYLRWHGASSPGALKLPPRLGPARPFPAPEEMITPPPEGAGEGWRDETAPPELVFGISFASKAATGDWERTSALLGATLRSLLNQSDPRFSVLIRGHERPDLAELDDPRVLFLEADIAPPKGPAYFRRDKMRKRRLIAADLRARGGGYFFPLDADDLVHRDFVAHVRATDNRRGYLVEQGFALDHANGVLAPIPGAWSVPFDRTCGSSAALYFTPEELPEDGELVEGVYFNLFQSHAYWPIIAEEFGRPLDPVPFAAGVYVVNHAQNLSFQLQRRGVRTENIIRAIARHRLGEGARILAEDFGQGGGSPSRPDGAG